jgi:hypothetical protein
MDPQKRQLRKLKRDIKRAGGKRRRHQLKRDLAHHPEEAHLHEDDHDFGRATSATLNGVDQDATRRRKKSNQDS